MTIADENSYAAVGWHGLEVKVWHDEVAMTPLASKEPVAEWVDCRHASVLRCPTVIGEGGFV